MADEFSVADPRAPDVADLLARHLAFAREVTPVAHVHALDADALLRPAVTLFGLRRSGALVAIGAVRELAADHGELKSMHVAADSRGQGVGRALLDGLLAVAAARGYKRVSLETGATDAFLPAHRLYQRAGFRRCPPFADYTDNPYSLCMTLCLTGEKPPRSGKRRRSR